METSNTALNNTQGEQLPVLDEQTLQSLNVLVHSLFAHGISPSDYEENYWRLLNASQMDEFLQPFERQTLITETQTSIKSIYTLYGIYNAIKKA